MKHKNLSQNLTEIQNDYLQHQIYNEVRHNSDLETWRHMFGVLGVVISIFGILGNVISLFILLRPSLLTSRKYSFKPNRSSHSSFEYKLSSFYAYLTALSFCDLFSCVFAILNMLEYIPPPYLDINLTKYREFCLSISVYTHPIATTLQALSVWLICAFSIHRCRSIVKPSNFLSSIKKRKCALTSSDSNHSGLASYLCHMKLKNNCTQKTYELKFFTKKILCIPILYCSVKSNENLCHQEPLRIQSSTYDMSKLNTPKKKIKKVKMTIFFLYILAVVYLIPQMFEKKLSSIEIQHKTYVFTTITSFGQTRLFRQIFHLWFYMFAIYILPFCLILIFNLVLLRAYFKSKKRCKKYKLKKDPSKILKDYNSFNTNVDDVELKETGLGVNLTAKPSLVSTASFKRLSNANQLNKITNRGRALTLTLFGVVAIFFICHFPAAIAKIIYVLYPTIEFDKSAFASICLDLSNFLIMCNSSINFLLYIVFGPAKFRQEFGYIFVNFFYLCKMNRNYQTNADYTNAQSNLTVDFNSRLRSNKSGVFISKERSFSNYYSIENSVNEHSKNFYLDDQKPSEA